MNSPVAKVVKVSGVRLEMVQISPISEKDALAPLVFLHEGLGSVAMWRDWPAQLCAATGRAGLVYSRRGYGRSKPVPQVRGASRTVNGQRQGRLLPDYMHEEAWTVLPALLRQLNIDNPVLIGHSDGGTIALLHASRFPVAACVVMAPHVIVEDISISAIKEAKVAFETGELRARLGKYHQDVDGAFWQWNDVWLSQAFRSFDIREDCRKIIAPVLALQGYDDPYGSMFQIDEIARVMRGSGDQGLQNQRIKLQKLKCCGHSPHRDQAAISTQLMVEFLQDIP